MNSNTKRVIPMDKLEQVADRAFGPAATMADAKLIDAGWFSTLYLLTLSTGLDVVLKVYPTPDARVLRYEWGILDVEVDALRRMRRDGVVPVPAVLYYDPVGEVLGSAFYIMDRVPGVTLGEARERYSEERQAELDADLGRLCRRINAVEGQAFGHYNAAERQHMTWSAAFAALVHDILDDAREHPVELPLPYDSLHDLLTNPARVFDEVVKPVLVHWDLNDSNVFVDEDGKITGILDFERCLWGDPLMELNFGVMYHSDSFNRGYGLTAPLSPSQRFRRAAYDVYLDLILVVDAHYRGYATESHMAWARGLLDRDLACLRAVS